MGARAAAVQDNSLCSGFLEATAGMLSVGMGTEQMARLIYSVARFVRARLVLEIGVGYSTPFLLQALQDNLNASARDMELFKVT